MSQTQARWALVGFGVLLLLIIAGAIFALGVGKMDQDYRGVVLRFGKVPRRKPVIYPGLFWRLPVINEIRRVKVSLQGVPLGPIRIICAKNIPMTLVFDMQVTVPHPIAAAVEVDDYLATAATVATQVCQEELSSKPFGEMVDRQVDTVRRLREAITERLEGFGTALVVFNVNDLILPPELLRSLIREAAAEYDYKGDIYTAGREGEIAAKMVEAAKKYLPNGTPQEIASLAAELRRNRAIEDMNSGGSVVVSDVTRSSFPPPEVPPSTE